MLLSKWCETKLNLNNALGGLISFGNASKQWTLQTHFHTNLQMQMI